MAVCVAVVAREGFPLFIKTVPSEDELKFTYIVYASMDVIDDRINNVGKSTTSDMRELYLGLLYPTEDYKVYGFITNTKVKFVVIIDASNVNIRDNEIKGMFRLLHRSYVDMLYNPFYKTNTPIKSKLFNEAVARILVDE